MISLNNIREYVLNFLGWKTNRKLLLIQSDDWGSVRISSKYVYNKLINCSDIILDDAYSKYDTIESPDDISVLLDLFSSVRDINNNNVKFTMNFVMGNPDFEKIRNNDYSFYEFETYRDTLIRYNREKSWDLLQEGIEYGILHPQFHGKEHINVYFWMQKLKEDHPGVRMACNYGVCSAGFKHLGNLKNNFQVAWEYYDQDHFNYIEKSIFQGLVLFKEYFNKDSRSVIAPSYTWSDKIEDVLYKNNVDCFQGHHLRKIHVSDSTDKYKTRFIYTGKRNHNKQLYLVRNAFFEPSHSAKWSGDNCLNKISIAFQHKKPAIISAHRVNFIGGLDVDNRNRNIKEFESMLRTIIKKWPDVEFLSTEDLIYLIIGGTNDKNS